MHEIILVKPCAEYADQVMRLKAEILAANDADCFAGCSFLEEYNDYSNWLERLAQQENPALLPAGSVPSGAWLAVRSSDNCVVGMIDLRHHIDHPILGLWGGHIGYTVRPPGARQRLRQRNAAPRPRQRPRAGAQARDGYLQPVQSRQRTNHHRVRRHI